MFLPYLFSLPIDRQQMKKPQNQAGKQLGCLEADTQDRGIARCSTWRPAAVAIMKQFLPIEIQQEKGEKLQAASCALLDRAID